MRSRRIFSCFSLFIGIAVVVIVFAPGQRAAAQGLDASQTQSEDVNANVNAAFSDYAVPEDAERKVDDAANDPMGMALSGEPAPEEYFRGKVVEVLKDENVDVGGMAQPYQLLTVVLLSGPQEGTTVEVEQGGELTIKESQRVKTGDTVVLIKNDAFAEGKYFIIDKYRLPALAWIFAAFFGLTVVFGRIRGFTSILGLGVSILILAKFVIPKVASGANPIVTSLIGAVIIALLSLFLAHGFNKRTSLALASTLLTLGISVGLAVAFVYGAKLAGIGTEEAYYLQFGPLENINLRGLLLGGIIIGVLGILDDITTAQTAAVDEISKANPQLTFYDLYRRGISIGKEHIASLVNTLVLAYVGASFPMLLVFSLNTHVPLWTTLNSEFVAEEVVRTLVGSTALIFAVPLTTVLAAFFYQRKKRSVVVSEAEPSQDSLWQ